MAWPNDYISGSCRVLPDNPNIYVLSADSTAVIGGVIYETKSTITQWVEERVQTRDMVSAAAGEILVIPEGVHVDETIAVFLTVEAGAGNDSTAYFACIVGENPNNKPTINFINNNGVLGSTVGLDLRGYSKIIDCSVGLTGNDDPANTNIVIYLEDNSKAIGCTTYNVSLPHASTSFIYFHCNGGVGYSPEMINCAHDINVTIDTTATITGVYCYNDTIVMNCTFNNLRAGVAGHTSGNVYVKNCCSQNCLYSFYTFGATMNYTTCADEQNLYFYTDGYSLAELDGAGTNLSYLFTDDIVGLPYINWERGCSSMRMNRKNLLTVG